MFFSYLVKIMKQFEFSDVFNQKKKPKEGYKNFKIQSSSHLEETSCGAVITLSTKQLQM